jgi:hypothetical protein
VAHDGSSNQPKRRPCADPARKGGHYDPVRRRPDGRRHGAHACQRKHWLAIPDRGGNVSGHGFVGHQLRLLRYAKGCKQVLYYEMVCGRWRAERELECETGMHARIIQSHMEMQITDSYRAVGLLRLTNGAVSCEQRLQYLHCATVGNCHHADSTCQWIWLARLRTHTHVKRGCEKRENV